MCPELAERLTDAELVDERGHATGNYSYIVRTAASGEHYVMLGDAYAFIDPVFSSGVMLAMNSAFAGADVVDATLDRAARGRARCAQRFERVMRRGRASSRGSSIRVTNPTMRELFMSPQNPFAREGSAALGAGRRRLRQDADLGLAARAQGIYYVVSIGHPRRTLARLEATPRQHPRRRAQASEAPGTLVPELRVPPLRVGVPCRRGWRWRPRQFTLRRPGLRHRRPVLDARAQVLSEAARWPTCGTPAARSVRAPPASALAHRLRVPAPRPRRRPRIRAWPSSPSAPMPFRPGRRRLPPAAHLERHGSTATAAGSSATAIQHGPPALLDAGQAAFDGAPAAGMGIRQGALCIRPRPADRAAAGRESAAGVRLQLPHAYGPRFADLPRRAGRPGGGDIPVHLGTAQHHRPRNRPPGRRACADAAPSRTLHSVSPQRAPAARASPARPEAVVYVRHAAMPPVRELARLGAMRPRAPGDLSRSRHLPAGLARRGIEAHAVAPGSCAHEQARPPMKLLRRGAAAGLALPLYTLLIGAGRDVARLEPDRPGAAPAAAARDRRPLGAPACPSAYRFFWASASSPA